MLRQIANLRGIASYVYCRTLINLEEPCRNLCVIHANVLPGSILTFEDTAQTVLVYPWDRLIYICGFALNKKRKKGMLLLLLWVYKGLG